MMALCFRLLACLLFVAALSATASAHTYHSTLTRMDYNAKEKVIEIGIQMFIHDVVPMIERRAGRPIDIAKSPDVDSILLKYLNEAFVLRSKSGEAQKIVWVGKEFENDVVYVYLEIPFGGDLAGATLRNSLFLESFEEQTNHVIVNFGQTKKSFLFKSGETTKEL